MKSAYTAVKNFITFIIIGIGSMLPGLSGATLAVVFGVYERLIRDLAKLRKYLIEDIKFIVLVILGFAIGTLICAKVLNHALEDYPVECLMFFIGLIIGQIPLLARTVNQDAKTERKGLYGSDCIIAFAVGLAITLFMIVLDAIGEADFDPEKLEQLYETLEQQGIEIIEDMGDIKIDDLDLSFEEGTSL